MPPVAVKVVKVADRWVLSIGGWWIAHEGGCCICPQLEEPIWDRLMLEEVARKIRCGDDGRQHDDKSPII